MKLKDRIALVTGGGTGIGRATCLRLAEEGAAVLINYRKSAEEAEAVAEEIRAAGGTAVTARADVSQEQDVLRMIAEVESRWGRLDLLVNNAGWSQVVPHRNLHELTDEIWDRTLNVNLRGAFYTVRAAVPYLRLGLEPSIVNVSSASAFHAAGSTIVYAASKAGLVSMTKSLARALAPQIRVNAVCPGLVRTRFAGWGEEAFEQAGQVTPIGRIVTAEEIADTILFLALATGITGEAVLCDGGVCQLGRSR
jgi:3-oxoacyl-[acyl-carrier protein] reductase